MSVDATRWAWKVDVSSSTKRLVLLALADRAGEEHTCYPSAVRMTKDTNLNRKTVLTAINDLIKDGLVLDTGERKGNGVRVLKLVGVHGRENETHPKKLTDTKNGTSTEIGMTSSTEIGMTTDTKNGIQNLKGNLTKNLTKNTSDKFDEFWNSVPNKDGKATARKSFEKAVKKKSVSELISAYAANIKYCNSVKRFYRNPTTWLNQEGWDDESIKPFINDQHDSHHQPVENMPQRKVVVKEIDYLALGQDLIK
ncbi:MAG: helix-turn-helix domain-containing protein [Acinetobacter sp.]